MKRDGNLFEPIVARENLRLAVRKALRGKRSRPEARLFIQHLDRNLDLMTDQLLKGQVPIGSYHQFVIRDPKERLITAPCFGERVLHHAVMNVCEPIMDRWLIAHSYACRVGKGRIQALHEAQKQSRRFPFFLKLDIRKYFDSISHERLLNLLTRRFKDARLLALMEQIVRGYRRDLGHGLPIGSLMSQHFANFYLGWFDRFVKQSLRIPGYVRYMDDMALWSPDREHLKRALTRGREFLWDELGLELKDYPYLNCSHHGMDFLGCRVYGSHQILNRRSRVRFRRKLLLLERLFLAGVVDERELQQRGTALVAFTQTPGLCSWNFRRAVLEQCPVGGPGPPTG